LHIPSTRVFPLLKLLSHGMELEPFAKINTTGYKLIQKSTSNLGIYVQCLHKLHK